MGLDITAYRGCKVIDAVFNGMGDPMDPSTRQALRNVKTIIPNTHFPGREAPFKCGNVVSFEESFYFRAWSYSGHSHFRSLLDGIVAGGISKPGDPFFELVCFSDCEGVIGTKACLGLSRDFMKYDNEFSAKHGDWAFLYRNWKKAFEFGSDCGFVDFH